VKQRPAVGDGIDGLVECRAPCPGHVHLRRRVKHDARLARRQAAAQPRAHADRVAGWQSAGRRQNISTISIEIA
jgi:hypothetical protein